MPGQTIYCHLASDGVHTNLQLYSLRQALRCQQELRAEVQNGLPEERLRERCVHILTTLGTSVTQLLGQNVESKRESRVDGPGALWTRFLAGVDMEGADRDELQRDFAEFLSFYDGCRHFGPPFHELIAQLDMDRIHLFIALTMRMWNVVLHHRKGQDREGNLDDFESIEVILAELAQWEPLEVVPENRN